MLLYDYVAGGLQVVSMDNGSEFHNAVVASLLEKFGVVVRTGAVKHPQPQGAAERFNHTLINAMCKTLDELSNWRLDLYFVLYYYRL